MDDDDMDERLVALRARVQAKLEASETAKTTRQQVASSTGS